MLSATGAGERPRARTAFWRAPGYGAERAAGPECGTGGPALRTSRDTWSKKKGRARGLPKRG